MGKLSSGKTKSGLFPGQFEARKGTFTGELVVTQLYHRDNWDKTARELCMGFILDIEDPEATGEPQENGLYRHIESFVKLQVDDDGNFSPGGAKSKAYKITSALLGEDFDSFSDDFEWEFILPQDVDLISIDDVPHHNEYPDGEEWLTLDDLTILNQSLYGNRAMFKFGHAQKPDKSYSDKITIIEAVALPKSQRSAPTQAAKPATKPASKPAAKPASKPASKPAAAPAAPVATGATNLPKYITWVHDKLAELSIPEEDQQPLMAFLLSETIPSRESFSKEQARTIKSFYDNDPDQITQAYAAWKETQAANGGEFPPEPEGTAPWDEEEDKEFA